ncbi:DUF2076 domain-containing protein [Rhizobium deserti]|uniref:DUF2076 domain-containing protein n=1 Tax=Rhizobium deserti TaxID=2547961 RepID=A0A4R5UMI9_9HYPH|nr:DUF2076 domain-containing protein [Rhizobium deserti]TDK39051.1 DUF2076 domain-containing protein [Rhizobium deserti]
MSPEERQLLTALFERVRTASSTPRDPEAEALIDQATRQQPYSTYYLAQAVIVQEKGLEAAAARIRELEERVRQMETEGGEHRHGEEGGGFLSSIFGSGQSPRAAPPVSSAPPSGPWSSPPRQNYQPPRGYDPRSEDDGYRAPQPSGRWGGQGIPSAGSSFLGGALGTAAGVAGGMLLANSLSGIFGNHMSSLGWGSPLAGHNPFGGEAANTPTEETVINNYYGDDAIREASNSDADNPDPSDGLQQADFGNDYAGDASDFGGDDLGGDDNLNV